MEAGDARDDDLPPDVQKHREEAYENGYDDGKHDAEEEAATALAASAARIEALEADKADLIQRADEVEDLIINHADAMDELLYERLMAAINGRAALDAAPAKENDDG